MRLQLRTTATSLEQQQAHDTHRPWVVGVLLLVLGLYAYAFTHVPVQLGLPPAQEVVESLGIDLEHVWDSDQNADSALFISESPYSGISYDDERALVFAAIAACFLCVYFLPVVWKKSAIVFWFLIAFATIYGAPAAAGLSALHLIVLLSFHPQRRFRGLAALAGGLLAYSLAPRGFGEGRWPAIILLSAGLTFGLYCWLQPAMLRAGRGLRVYRTLLIQTPMLLVCSGAMAEGAGGEEWKLPLGILLWLWQWQRLMVYHADYRSGDVPEDIAPSEYLSLFLSPAVVLNWTWSPYVGQAYSYLSSRFYCEDKNTIALAGLRILGLAFAYLLFADWTVQWIIANLDQHFGITAYRYVTELVREYRRGTPIAQSTVLFSTMLDQFRVFLVFGSVLHFRVGIWRMLGYQVDPQYNRFWTATNLASLWGRYAFHYREFLVRCFYYPVFFRFFKKHLVLRVFVATLVATALGNHLWGHIPDRLLDRGITASYMTGILRRWPYFMLLGLSISLTQVYLMRKGRTRKPWALDRRLPLDLLCSYLTFQFFSLIHVFARPRDDLSTWDLCKLFLKGLGWDLGGPSA